MSLVILDLVGIFVFAVTGALVAALGDRADLPRALVAAVGAAVCLAWRLAAVWRRWTAPVPRGPAAR